MKVIQKYNPWSKQEQFHKSTAKFRGFIGGLGSGKSICGAVECVLAAFEYPHSLGVILAPCYDDQTEILTSEGWRLLKKLDGTEEVATLQGEELKFIKPKNYFAFPFAGEMIGIKNQEIDMLVTPNHRCLARFKRKEWKIKTAQELYGRTDWKFRKTATWNGLISGPLGYSKDWFEFLGYWFAEGHAEYNEKDRKYRVILTTVKDIEYCEELMHRNFKKFSKDKRNDGGFNFTVYNKALALEFSAFGKALTKKIPKFVKEASSDLIKAFLKGFITGDGHWRKSKHDETQMFTSSGELADGLQELALKAGYNCSLSSRIPTHNKFSNNREYRLCIRQGKREPKIIKKHWYKQRYDGMVYCVEVEGGIVMVRRNGKFYFCGNTYPMLRDSTIKTFFEECPKEFILYYNRSEQRVKFINGSEILFRPGNDAAAIDRLRNMNVDWFWMDEASLFLEYAWKILVGRLRGKTGPRRGWITTTPKGYNWAWKKFVSGATHDYFYVTASSLENPYLPEDYKKSLQEEYSGQFAKQEIYGMFVGFEGAVYPEFNRITHVIDTSTIKFDAIVAGVDFGFTNPSVILKVGIDSDGRMYVLDEFYERHVTDSDLAEWAKNNLKDVSLFICDSENPSGIQEFKDRDLECKGVEKKTNEPRETFITAGIKRVSNMLTIRADNRARLYVDKKCVNTIMEFENYRYPEKEEEKPIKETPLKVHDHCYRPDMEMLTADGWKFIGDVRIGDMVPTLKDDYSVEMCAVESIIRRRSDEMIEYGPNHHIEFSVTPDHNLVGVTQYDAKKGNRKGRMQFFKASSINKRIWIPRTCRPFGRNGWGKLSAYLLGFYLAEGCKSISQGRKYVHVDNNDENKITRALSGYAYSKSKRHNTIRASVRSDYLFDALPHGRSWEKRIPREFLANANYEEMRACLDGLMDGDGTKNRNWTYTTVSRGLADDVQELCIKMGMNATVYKIEVAGMRRSPSGMSMCREVWRVLIKTASKSRMSTLDYRKMRRVKYDGDAVCVTVKNHRILVRLNGKAFWCGQCMDALRYVIQTLGEAIDKIIFLEGENEKQT